MLEGRSSEQIFAEAVGYHQAGHLGEAERAYRAVVALEPRHAESLNGLGRIACRTARYAGAVDLFRKAIAIDPSIAHFHLNLGNALKDLGRLDEAIASYQRAIALKPDFAEAYGNLGSLYISQGQKDAACRAYESAIERAPRRGSFYRLRAFVEPLEPGSALFGQMEKLAASLATLAETDQMDLHFALGTAYADCGEHQRSFAHLLSGNRLKRKRVVYDEVKAFAWLARIETVFSRDLLAARRDFGASSRLPIFVVGMPRSGSTLVEQILASHPAVFGAGELRILPHLLGPAASGTKAAYPEMAASLNASQVARLAEQYLAILSADAPRATRIVDKHLENFTGLGLISLMLPEAKIIHIRRNPVDTCLSCFAQLFNGNHLPYTYDLAELGRYYRAYARLMDHWRAVLPRGMMIEVAYEDLIEDFDREARRIVEHCGVAWDERCRNFFATDRVVKTASALQVRRPIYRSSLVRWRAFGDLARPLIDALPSERVGAQRSAPSA